MSWKESIEKLYNSIIEDTDKIAEYINATGYDKPVFVLKLYSDGLYSCYIENEEENK